MIVGDSAAAIEAEPKRPEPAQARVRHPVEWPRLAREGRKTPEQLTDLSANEIAEQLDLTAGNVRVLRHRALAKLRAAFAENPS
jgi:hypothetical protein